MTPRRSLKLLLGCAIVAALATGAWWLWRSGAVGFLVDPAVGAEEKLAALKGFFGRFGVFAPLVYIGLVVVEVVVAPLPGAMLYAPGGVIFGATAGGLYSLIGNVLGAGIACQLMRWLGGERLRAFAEKQELQKYERQLESHGVLVVFLLRVNPLTSSDLVSYAAGLTSIPVWKVMAGTLLGMAPLCFVQARLADGLLTAFPHLIYPLAALCVVYVGVVLWVVQRMRVAART